jgi:PKD repeat protein
MPLNRTLLSLLIALSFAFSGCLGFLGEDVEQTDDENGLEGGENGDENGGTDGDNGDTGQDGNQTDEAPVASLSANVTAGEAPLAVSFTLDAEYDGFFTLTWTLDLGEDSTENGRELPATVDHTFETPGNYTVVLNVSAGEDSSEANLTIAVSAPEVDDPVVLEGELMTPHPALWMTGSETCVSFMTGVGGVDCEFFEIEEEWIGRPFTSDAPEGDIDLEFRTDCSATSESVRMFGDGGHESGTIPADSGCVVVANFLSGGPFTFTIS